MLMLLALVVVVAGAWAVLATLFTPPLTVGAREAVEAVGRRWGRSVVVLGLAVAGMLGLWLLVVKGLGPYLSWP